jgi:hypothetical protein
MSRILIIPPAYQGYVAGKTMFSAWLQLKFPLDRCRRRFFLEKDDQEERGVTSNRKVRE